MSGDRRTPEERLLSKKRLGSFYLADVRALIAERDAAREALDVLSRWPPGEGVLGMCQYARAALASLPAREKAIPPAADPNLIVERAAREL